MSTGILAVVLESLSWPPSEPMYEVLWLLTGHSGKLARLELWGLRRDPKFVSKTVLGVKKQLVFKSSRIEAHKKVLGPGCERTDLFP